MSEQWAVIALVGMLLTLTVRFLFLGSLFSVLKAWGKEPYRQILKEYARRSTLGWLSMLLGVGISELAISFPSFWHLGPTRREGVFLFVIFLFLGILLHAKALCAASSTVLKRRAETETIL